jgi:hypothetical protein
MWIRAKIVSSQNPIRPIETTISPAVATLAVVSWDGAFKETHCLSELFSREDIPCIGLAKFQDLVERFSGSVFRETCREFSRDNVRLFQKFVNSWGRMCFSLHARHFPMVRKKG